MLSFPILCLIASNYPSSLEIYNIHKGLFIITIQLPKFLLINQGVKKILKENHVNYMSKMTNFLAQEPLPQTHDLQIYSG